MATREFVTVERGPLWRSHATLNAATASLEIPQDNSMIDHVVHDLLDTMHFHPTCVGLAAPQIGSNLRIAVVRDEVTPDGKDLVLVNPTIHAYHGHPDGKNEACMSIPGWHGLVKRKLDIELTFLTDDAKDMSIQANDFFARVIQHEVDHLDGILYPARMRDTDELMERESSSN